MNVFIRSFNQHINSKTGAQLHYGQFRGTPEWLEFEKLLGSALRELGHERHWQEENPRWEDHPGSFDKRIYVHKCKRDIPHGDLFYMQMHMRDLFTIDTNGWGFDHSGKDLFHPDIVDEEEAVNFCVKKSDELFASGESKCPQPTDNNYSDLPHKFILVPVQIPRDYTIIHHSPITVKYFIESISAWAEETANHVVFKLHPHNKYDVDLISAVNDGCESRFVHQAEGNIHELIKRSAGLFVINSGTGFEAVLHGKPVCTFGNCDYNKVTFNADIRRLDEARNFIYSYKPDFRAIGYKYVFWYYTVHAYSTRDELTKQRLETYLKGVLK